MKNYHFVVDNSNIIIGAKIIPETGQINQAVRVNITKLVEVIQQEKLEIEMKTRIVAGSYPIGSDNTRLETEWTSCKYRCMFTERIGSVIYFY